MKRVYHHYKLWEDHKAGFYNKISGKEADLKVFKVLEMFKSEVLTDKFMNKVICEWKYSCEHNLTNESLNKIAYIGQAACCLYAGVPCDTTMKAWKLLPFEVRERSDEIANKTIKKWMLRRRLKSTSISGKKKDTKEVYQTKLLLF